jgi:protein SCO1
MTTRLPALALAALLALPAAARAGAPAAAERDAKARGYFTDTLLLTQSGRPVRFYDDVLRGKVVLVSFMFTACNDACPLITQKMNAIRHELGDAFGAEVQFVSLSVDPDNDTPAALRAFAERQRAVHPAWTFLTGPKPDLNLVLAKLGQLSDDPTDHFTGFLAGNARTGHWQKVRPDAPAESVAEILRTFAAEPAAGEALSAAKAP